MWYEKKKKICKWISMFDVIKKILISEKEFTETNYKILQNNNIISIIFFQIILF